MTDCVVCQSGGDPQIRMCVSTAKDKDGYHWFCTRPLEHDGDHVACGGGQHGLFTWTTAQALPVEKGDQE